MSYFQKNIEALQNASATLAKNLSDIKEVEDFEIYMDENDVATLNFVQTKHFIALYEGSPAERCQTQIKEFEIFAKYPYLYFYGFGNGTFLKHLLTNQNHKCIVVIEPEPELLYVVLHMIDFSQEIENGRLVLFGKNEVTFPVARALFDHYEEQKYAKVYDLHIMTSYYEKCFHEDMLEVNRRLIEGAYHAINAAGNDAKDALIGLKHHIINLAKLFETPPLVDLLNKLNTTDTAVLVSTGPSLTKQLPLLKKIAPYVRIIAVDASFPVLYKAGIKPDVVVSMERVKESARFFEQVPKDGYQDVVIALSSLQHKDVIESPKGGILQISLRPLGYMIATGPKEWGFLGIGSSAANMGYELIFYSGFKNCILIGQDLAYAEDGASHAKGHVFGENDVQTKETDVWVEGWGGEKKVRTNHTWTMFRNFFEKDIGDIKDRMLTINATEGGARIFGTKELSFEKAIEICVNQSQKKKNLELAYMSQEQQKDVATQTWGNVKEIKNYVSALLEEVKVLFLDVANASERELETLAILELQSLISRVEKIKARYSEELFERVVWHIAQSIMLVQEVDLVPLEVYICNDQEAEKERLFHLVQQYKRWLFSFASVMDATLKTIDYAKARTLINEVDVIGVFVNDEKIDSFTYHDLTPNAGRVFDVDMRGILYDVPDEYQEKINAVAFRDAKSGEALPRAFVDVIKRDDEKYNELSFMKSLEEPITESLEVRCYKKKTLGFLATDEDLDDTALMEYFLELLYKIEKLEVHVFTFDDQVEKRAKTFFSDYVKQVSFFKINHISMLIENVNIAVLTHKTVLNYKIFALLQEKTHILVLHFNETAKEMSIGSVKQLHLQNKHPLLMNPEYFGFTYEALKKADMSVHRTLYENYFGSIDEDENLYEFAYIKVIKNVLNNTEMRNFVVDYLKAEYQYNVSRN